MILRRLRKIGRMGPGEILWRLRQLGVVRYHELLHDLGRTPPCALLAEPEAPGGVRPELLLPPAKWRREVVEWLRRERPAYVARIRREADAVCDHRFVLLGTEVRYGREVEWCADPVSGRAWPMAFHSRVPIFGGDTGSGDCKYVWELNRHQFLPTLGKAYWLTGDTRYVEAAAGLVRSWIGQNPFRIGINWASGLEVAVRSLAWSWTYAFVHDSAAFDARVRQLMLGSLWQHGKFIEEHLSRYFSPYNHLVGELTALFVLGSVFPFMRRASAWQRKGWGELVSILPLQFHPDGGSVEQSTSYHHFTLGFYVQALLLRRALGQAVPEAVSRRLERAFEFSMYMTKPDGSLPMIGDADEARSLELGQASLWDYRPYLALGAALFRRGDMKRIAGAFPEEGVWLVGLSGLDEYERLGACEPPRTSRLLPDSGYAVMRTGWGPDAHYLALDCGRLAAGVSEDDAPSAAHGHADALSIEVSGYGEPALVDPGFFTYNGDPEWHRYFRETAAHNTAVVDGRSQAEFRGRLTWSHAPRTALHHWMTSATIDYVEASHNGYERLPQPVRHRRSALFLKPDYWFVRDEFTGAGTHQLDRYFHFTPGELTCDPEAGVVTTRRASGETLALIPVEREGVETVILRNGPAPCDGWLGVGYEKKIAAPVVRYRTARPVPATLHTLVAPLRGPACVPAVEPAASHGHAPLAGAFVVTVGARRDLLLFGQDGDVRAVSKTWVTDAHVAVVRLDERGEVAACALIGGSVLTADGATVLRLGTTIGFAALGRHGREVVVEVSEPVEVSAPFPGLRVAVTDDPTAKSRP